MHANKYRQRIEPDRLDTVADDGFAFAPSLPLIVHAAAHVRRWYAPA